MAEHALEVQKGAQLAPIDLIQQALSSGTSPEVIRELVQLQQSMERFNWEREERQAKIDFDAALNHCQSQIGRIAPNQKRENNIQWADYAHLDRTMRPIYIEAGFSIGFSEAESADKGRLRMCAVVSRGGVSREYFADISRSPANGKMSQLDADAAAASRVKRYLMLDIFNIAIGIDKDEKGGILPDPVHCAHMDNIKNSSNTGELTRCYLAAIKEAGLTGDKTAVADFETAANKRKGELAR